MFAMLFSERRIIIIFFLNLWTGGRYGSGKCGYYVYKVGYSMLYAQIADKRKENNDNENNRIKKSKWSILGIDWCTNPCDVLKVKTMIFYKNANVTKISGYNLQKEACFCSVQNLK